MGVRTWGIGLRNQAGDAARGASCGFSTLNPYRGWKSVFGTDGGAGDKRIRDNQAEVRDGRPYTGYWVEESGRRVQKGGRR